MPIKRLSVNPILQPKSVHPSRDDLEVYCTINPGAVFFHGEYLLLVRVGQKPLDEPGTIGTLIYDEKLDELVTRRYKLDDPELTTTDARAFFYRGKLLLTSLSHLRVARSKDLVHWQFDPTIAIAPSSEWEAYGCEDARITFIDGRYYVTYTAVGHLGINEMLAVTEDFVHFEKIGIIFPTFNKDVCIFPELVRGQYVCRHRPYRSEFNEPYIATAWSPDLIHWGEHSVLHRPVPGTWEGERVGGGAPPLRTDKGWLEVYHGTNATGRYSLGAMLSDLEWPECLLTRSRRPILEPQAAYETKGVYGQCVFSNGLVADDNGIVTIFYGGADTVTAAAQIPLQELLDLAENRA